jgi:hypothetical protein
MYTVSIKQLKEPSLQKQFLPSLLTATMVPNGNVLGC